MGQRRTALVTGSDGVARGIGPNDMVVVSAPGLSPSARIGPGPVHLQQMGRGERLVARRQRLSPGSERVVGEVIADSHLTGVDASPRTGRLLPGRSGDAVPTGRFRDIAGHPLAAHIEALASRDIIAGDPDGRFRPNDTVTRAEFATVLVRSLELPLAPLPSPFPDVVDGSWYAPAVAVAARVGALHGDPDGSFRPAGTLTRAEVAATLFAVADFSAEDVAGARRVARFADIAADHWALAALQSLQGICAAFEVSDGQIRASAPMTRAEVAAALSRFLACEADRALNTGTAMSSTAAQATWTSQTNHLTLLRDRGIGTHYGDGSRFHALAANAKQAFLDDHLRAGQDRVTTPMLTRSSCIEYVMEQTAPAFDTFGQQETWRAIDSRTRADNLKGTTFAKTLVEQGWRAILVVATTNPALVGDDREHAYSLALAQREHAVYGVPLEGVIESWLGDEAQMAAMDALVWGVLVQRGGYHVVAVANGTVHELARSEGPHQQVIYAAPWRDIVSVYAHEVYNDSDDSMRRALRMWGSGILVVPPGVQVDGVSWF
jgi:hypothetical protein